MRWLLCAVLVACSGTSRTPAPSGPVTEYRGGRWYDGAGFVSKTMWVAGDHFVAQPAHVAQVVELDGGFVVPPYGEGHNHWLEPALVDTYVGVHLRQGIFYVRDMSTAPVIHDAMRSKLNRPDSVDYIAAHQGFTGPGGHPIELVDLLSGAGVLPKEWAAKHGEGDAVFYVASPADVAKVWPRLMEGRPDFVKLFLARSEDYGKRNDDPTERGVDPALVPGIVSRAHEAKLRVAAHIVTAHDFQVAVAAGVDDLAHQPFVKAGDLARYRIDDVSVQLAGERRLTVATTTDWLDGAKPGDPRLAVVRDNLARLRAAGAVITIGTDLFRTTAHAEVARIRALGLMTPAELLHAWCVDTPRSIFPNRTIGKLVTGAEASFLVLRGDPLADIAQTANIVRWVKQGRELHPAAMEMPALPR